MNFGAPHSVADVCDWLLKISPSFETYLAVFRENSISGDVLLYLYVCFFNFRSDFLSFRHLLVLLDLLGNDPFVYVIHAVATVMLIRKHPYATNITAKTASPLVGNISRTVPFSGRNMRSERHQCLSLIISHLAVA